MEAMSSLAIISNTSKSLHFYAEHSMNNLVMNSCDASGNPESELQLPRLPRQWVSLLGRVSLHWGCMQISKT